MTEKTIDLDQHRGMAAQKATELRRLLANVGANEKTLRLRQDELEARLIAAPAANGVSKWPRSRRAGGGSDQLPPLSLNELFRQRFLVRPFAGRNRVMRIDAEVWSTPCVDAHPISCAQRITLTGEQETRGFP
jgi:hypothetical protein